MLHPVFSIYRSPPGVGRANPRARPEHAVPVFARRWLRTPRFEYRMHGAIGRRRRRRHTLRVHGRRARLLWPHGPFTRRSMCCAMGSPCSPKRTARISGAIRSMNSRTRSSRYASIFWAPTGYVCPPLRMRRLERRCKELRCEQLWITSRCHPGHIRLHSLDG